MLNTPGDPIRKRTLNSLTPASTACTNPAGIVCEVLILYVRTSYRESYGRC